MKQLETQFTQNDNVFTQLKRNDKAALYKRTTLEGTFVSYEVFAVRSKDGAEVYPNQTAMSRWAWCPVAEDRANLWFDRITNGDIPIPEIDPVTGEVIQTADKSDLNDLPDVVVPVDVTIPTEVSTVVVVNDDPTAPTDEVPEVEIPTVDMTDDGGVVTMVKVAKTTKAAVTYNYPTGDFTQAQFAIANGMPVRGTVWGVLDKLVSEGKLNKELRKLGKGRPSQIFSVKS